MNFFRRKKKIVPGNKTDEHVFEELYTLFMTHGDAILSGKIKLSLTAHAMILLNSAFQKLTEGVNQPCFQVANHVIEETQSKYILFIFEFVQKVISLKVISGIVSTDCPLLSAHFFKALEVLEIRKIPVKHMKNLHSVRRQLKSLTCCRSTSVIQDVVDQFSRDKEELFILPSLKILNLSCNTIKHLMDAGLKLLPALEILNVSFNCITNADSETMPSVSQLNLGYNTIATVPVLPSKLAYTLTHLILRNNNISSLKGIHVYSSLKLLDLTANCIIEFQEITPLAYLELLVTILLSENPICYKEDYRLRTIRILSPMKRNHKIKLDDVELDSVDMCHLGEDVEPVLLSQYIPERPIGRPNGSIKGLVNSLPRLSGISPFRHSTPTAENKITKATVREAFISDPSCNDVQPNSITPVVNGGGRRSRRKSNFSFDNNSRTDSLNNVYYSSRRNSLDNSLVWVNTSTGSVRTQSDLSNSAPRLDYDSWPAEDEIEKTVHLESDETSIDGSVLSTDSYSPLHSISSSANDLYENRPMMSLATVEQQINATEETDLVDSHDSDALKKCISEEYMDNDNGSDENYHEEKFDTDVAFLVENVLQRDDSFDSEEKENLFVTFKLPYLIERSDDGKLKNKLDLSYLQKLTIKDDELKLFIRFNLIRSDWQLREYIFDQKEQLNAFLDIIQPIEVKNYKRKISEMTNCECLKCGTTFLNDPGKPLICPKCESTMVVDKNDNHVHVFSENKNEESADSVTSNVFTNDETDNFVTPREDFNESFSKDNTFILSPRYHSADDCLSKNTLPSSSWPPNMCQLCIDGKMSALPASLPKNFVCRLDKYFASNSQKQTAYTNETDTSMFNKHSYENSQLSYSSSQSPCRNSYYSKHSKGHSRQPSRSSVRSRTPRSTMNTPVIGLKGTLLSDLEDFNKCDHRLKLFLTMSVYKSDNEDFLCQLRCVSCKNLEKFDCLLIISDKNVYIMKIINPDSDSPEECLKVAYSSSLNQLKYVSYGYWSQSFTFDFMKSGYYFKFLVCDNEKTNKFLRKLEEKLSELLLDSFPTFVKESNPQTLFDIRRQVFGFDESPKEKGKRIYDQLTIFSSSPLLKTKKIRLRTHHDCFLAKELIDWLITRKEANTRLEAIDICTTLVKSGIIYHVSKEQQFKDDDGVYKFIQFTADTQLKDNTEAHDQCVVGDEKNECDTNVMAYLIGDVRINEHDSTFHERAIVLTNSHIFLCEENHQWPLSRLHVPPSGLRVHYTLKEKNKITNVTSIEYFDDSPCHALISFDNEDEDYTAEEVNWFIYTKSVHELNTLIGRIKKNWEELFAIELTTTSQPSVVPILDSYILV